MNINSEETGLVENNETKMIVVNGNEKAFEVKEFGMDIDNKLNFNDFLNWTYKNNINLTDVEYDIISTLFLNCNNINSNNIKLARGTCKTPRWVYYLHNYCMCKEYRQSLYSKDVNGNWK